MASQRTIVITGASAGIGAELARHLGAAGHRLVLAARTKDRLESVARDIGNDVRAVATDVTSRAAVERLRDEAIRAFGHVDVWVNNAGRGISRPVAQLTDDDVDEMMRVNVKSALYGMQEILPHFIERGSGQIVNVSSMLGRVPSAAFRSAYNGAKAFLNAITTNLRDELREAHPGILVSLVSPGVVSTDFGNSARHGGPDSRALPMSQPVEEVADVIVRVIDTRAPDVYTRSGMRQYALDYLGRLGADPS
jgi:short-subunit dehydrogenase